MKLSFATKHLLVLVVFSFCFLIIETLLLTSQTEAQFQDFTFSANTPESYQCFTQGGDLIENGVASTRGPGGYFLCLCNESLNQSDLEDPDKYTIEPQENGVCPAIGGGAPQTSSSNNPGAPGNVAIRAVLRPAKLQQIEIWFFRIIYIVWAAVASLSFFYLVLLGYRYIITRGDVTKITEIRQKIVNYLIGLALVFLSVPILTTIFNLLGINDDVPCYSVDVPGFRFFFGDVCQFQFAQEILENPCAFAGGSPDGILCPQDFAGRASSTCDLGGNRCYIYQCDITAFVWVRSQEFPCT